MAKFTKDNFTFFDGFFEEPVFSLDSLDKKNIDYLVDKKFKSVAIDNSILGCISFEKLDFIEEIYISNNVCVDELYKLENLKRVVINIDNKNKSIDFYKFPKLEILSIDWYNNFPDLSKNENLRELSIWKFKPKSKSLAELSLPKRLEKLHITESNILDLSGLNLFSLKDFEAYYCSALNSVKGIESFSNNLNVMILENCRKLTYYEDIKYAKKLNKLILTKCGNMPNIKWIKELKNIKHFSFFDTKLVDGDTSYCFGIDYVSFKNQKHYNYKIEEFN